MNKLKKIVSIVVVGGVALASVVGAFLASDDIFNGEKELEQKDFTTLQEELDKDTNTSMMDALADDSSDAKDATDYTGLNC